MPTYGETETGFRRKTFVEIRESMKSRLRSRVDERLTLDGKDPFGDLIESAADEISKAWETLEVARNGFDPANAEGQLMVSLAELTGTKRRDPKVGSVAVTLGLEASKTYAPGELVAHVIDEPDNRWVNRDIVASTTAGSYPATFVSESPGSAAVALAGTLTVLAEDAKGWLSITNAGDATPGRDQETIDELRARRPQELALGGSRTVAAIKAAVLQVTGVTDAFVEENDTDATVGALTPHSIRVVLYDGASADALDDEIAQAIWDNTAGGIATIGTSSGTAIDAEGNAVTVNFQRATVTDIHVAVTVVAPNGASEDEIKDAILAVAPTTIAETAYFVKLQCSALDASGVTDISSFAMEDTDPPAATVNIVPAATEKLNFDSANIDVTITP